MASRPMTFGFVSEDKKMQRYAIHTSHTVKVKNKSVVRNSWIHMNAENIDNLRKNILKKVKNSKKQMVFEVWTLTDNTTLVDKNIGTISIYPGYEGGPQWVVRSGASVFAYDISARTGKISNKRRI